MNAGAGVRIWLAFEPVDLYPPNGLALLGADGPDRRLP